MESCNMKLIMLFYDQYASLSFPQSIHTAAYCFLFTAESLIAHCAYSLGKD